MTIRLLIADDHPIVRDGLKMLLNLQDDMIVVAEAEDGVSALQLAQKLCPDVAIMDIGMPKMNGIDCAEALRKQCPHSRIIMLSIHGTSEYIIRAIQAGAMGYLLKDSLSKEIVRAIQTVHEGQYILSRKIARILGTLDIDLQDATRAKSPLAKLSPQENRVLQHVVEGMTSAEIAEHLSLSPKTIETYRSRIMKKLGVNNMPELVKFTIIHGVSSLDT